MAKAMIFVRLWYVRNACNCYDYCLKSSKSRFNNLMQHNEIVIKYFIIKKDKKAKEPYNGWVKLKTNSGIVVESIGT